MKITWPNLRAPLALALAASLACPPAHALVALNDGHDRIYVVGSFGVSHDSNVFAQNGGAGDILYTTAFSADYRRSAGWIGLNANVAISGAHYGSIKGQDYSDPALSVELTKQSGRTTGSLTLSAARESRADAAVNTRNSSWNYTTGLSFRYHIAGNNDLSGGFSYNDRQYLDDVAFANLATYSNSFDLFHLFNSERDMILGYRYRYNDTSRHTSSSDHAFTAGLHGKIIRGIMGTLRAGYQVRASHGRSATGALSDQKFQSWTASGSGSYAINKKTNLSAQISKDFSTTATDSSVDGLTASLDGQYAYNSHWALSSSVGGGNSKFLGDSGRLAPGGPQRQDTYFNWSTSGSYSLNEHLKASLTYLWFKNWSTSSFADFVRTSWSFNVSSRW